MASNKCAKGMIALQTNHSSGRVTMTGTSILALLLLGCLVSCLDSGSRSPAVKTPYRTSENASPTPPELRIPYRVVKEWEIPNGGYGRVIVIDPAYRNEKDMRSLGDNLRYATKDDRMALIEVYDSKKAAGMRNQADTEKLSKKSQAYYDKHLVGQYIRNTNTGHHAFKIWLKERGMPPSLELKY